MRILAIGNQKGGVGKTTTAYNLAFALSDLGRRVLLVDLDPQASLTVAAGLGDYTGRSMAEVLTKGLEIAGALVELRPGLALVPSDITLSEAEIILVGKIGREAALKKALRPVANGWDYALIDLPPSLGILTVNGLAAAHQVLIPAIPQYLDLRALAIFTQTIELVKQEINPTLEIAGILPTFYDNRLKLHAEVLATWEAAGLPLLPLRVKRSVRFAESPISGSPVATYSPELGEVYKELAEMLDHA
jgi:chromosome partitioning protein